jgi:hypothetical protein
LYNQDGLEYEETKLWNSCIDPNVAYTLLVTGILLGLLALVTPGTGALEIGALFAFTIAAYGAYNLEINPWALVVLVLALVPFLYSLRLPKWRMALLGATVLLVVVGSVFMFVGENGWPAVNPIVATVVSLMYGGFLYSCHRPHHCRHASPPHPRPGKRFGWTNWGSQNQSPRQRFGTDSRGTLVGPQRASDSGRHYYSRG